MPLIPEEPEIHESVPGPRAPQAAGRAASTPRPVPGPRPAGPSRPGRPGQSRASTATAVRGSRESAKAAKPAQPAASASPQVQLIPAPVAGAVDAAEEAVDLLLDSGRAPHDVLVLTTGDQHPWAAHELSFGGTSYWAQQDAREDVFYADASADRLAPRPVVVLAVNGGTDEVIARALAGAMTRAGALLVVCGDPQHINTLAGVGA
ncbi:hypothetical protein [Streptomyces meridianus]|uniref:Uncharacterized protein n=1 Tax=Streptomyces meridianus TaxID=2938945 RepID=A0ABT0XAT0_9ACTN|nr:hypothetical protein [Streptomyces meridianus]MCM2578822.1 hypothetical protein [Streptomyces meridianus]